MGYRGRLSPGWPMGGPDESPKIDRRMRSTLRASCLQRHAPHRAEVDIPTGHAISMWDAIGGFTVGCPLYLAELAPIDLRGRIVSLFQVQVGLGVVVAFGLGSLFARLNASHALWKWCLGAGTAPAVVLLFLLAWISGRSSDNGGCTPSRTPVEVPAQLVIQQCSDERRPFRRKNLRPILLATSIALFNQLSGVNIVLLYMLDILASAGIGFDSGIPTPC